MMRFAHNWKLWLAVGLLWLVYRPGRLMAHTMLVSAVPAPGAVAAESLTELRLTFNEPLAVDSKVVLYRENFQVVPGVASQVDAQAAQQLAVSVPPLAPGVYTVQWMTRSLVDNHPGTGSYAFAVQEQGNLSGNWVLVFVILAVLALAYLAWQPRRET